MGEDVVFSHVREGRNGSDSADTWRNMPQEVDYAGAHPELQRVLDGMRNTMTIEQRLLMIKLVARTIAVDSTDNEERGLAILMATTVANYFQHKHPEAPRA